MNTYEFYCHYGKDKENKNEKILLAVKAFTEKEAWQYFAESKVWNKLSKKASFYCVKQGEKQ